MNLCAADFHGRNTEFVLHFIKVSLGSTAPAKNWRLCLIQNANEAVWVFAYLNLDYGKHFWVKVNLDLEAKPAGSWVWAVLEWCRIHRRGREELVLPVCALVYVCVRAYMCVCVCMNGWCDREEKSSFITTCSGTFQGSARCPSLL